MDALLTGLGLVIAVFLVLSAAVESVVDVLRGFTGKFFTSLNGAIPLNEALEQAMAFAPENGQLQARLDAIKLTADRVGADVSGSLNRAKTLISSASGALGAEHAARFTEHLNEAAGQVTQAINDYERHRILLVRSVSGLIGIGIAFSCKVDAFDLLQGTGAPSGLQNIANIPLVGEILTGLSAAGGSSYWHDKLDKVRSLKAENERVAGLRT